MSLVLIFFLELLEFLLKQIFVRIIKTHHTLKRFSSSLYFESSSTRILSDPWKLYLPKFGKTKSHIHFPSFRTVLWNNLILSSLSVRFTLQYTLFGFQWTYPALSSFVHTFVCRVGQSGLEPPTSRLSGARSNQLSYEPVAFCLSTQVFVRSYSPHSLVEMKGFEPLTPCLQGRCSPSWATPPWCFNSFWMISFRSFKIEQ